MTMLEAIASKFGIKMQKKIKKENQKPIDTSNLSVAAALAIHGGKGVIVNQGTPNG